MIRMTLHNACCLGFYMAGMKRRTQCQRMPEGFQSPLLCSQTLPASVDPWCTECRNKLLRSENAECFRPAFDQRGRAGASRHPSLCKDPEAILILNNALCLLSLHTCIICLHYVLSRGMSACFCLYSKAGLFIVGKVGRKEGKQGNVHCKRHCIIFLLTSCFVHH